MQQATVEQRRAATRARLAAAAAIDELLWQPPRDIARAKRVRVTILDGDDVLWSNEASLHEVKNATE